MPNVFSSKRSCGETELTMSSFLENKSLKIPVSSENTFEFCDFAFKSQMMRHKDFT
jgi:hypothetical protein